MRNTIRQIRLPRTCTALAVAITVLLTGDPMLWRQRADGQQRKNYDRIEKGLYLGGNVPEPPPGTTAVLNVGTKRDAYRVEFHEWNPIFDGPSAPSLDWLRTQVAFIDKHRKAGRTVYVHCNAGISRGGLVMTAFLMWRDGISRNRALKIIRTQRPEADPNAVFMKLLLEWGKTVKKKCY